MECPLISLLLWSTFQILTHEICINPRQEYGNVLVHLVWRVYLKNIHHVCLLENAGNKLWLSDDIWIQILLINNIMLFDTFPVRPFKYICYDNLTFCAKTCMLTYIYNWQNASRYIQSNGIITILSINYSYDIFYLLPY